MGFEAAEASAADDADSFRSDSQAAQSQHSGQGVDPASGPPVVQAPDAPDEAEDSFADEGRGGSDEEESDDEERPIPDGFANNIPSPFPDGQRDHLRAQAQPADAAMRVTWTDLARRNTIKKGGLAEGTMDSGQASSRHGGVTSPRDGGEAGEDGAEFSLARQREHNMRRRGDLPSSDEDDDEEAAFAPTGDGPVEYKSNYGRRKTLARAQLLASESVDQLLADRSLAPSDSGLATSQAAGHPHEVGEDTEDGDGDDENIDIFDAFKFKSFRRQK